MSMFVRKGENPTLFSKKDMKDINKAAKSHAKEKALAKHKPHYPEHVRSQILHYGEQHPSFYKAHREDKKLHPEKY
jgi:hypothetical protein